MKRKPRVYLEKEIIGQFMLEPTVKWVARDFWGNMITTGDTRRECEAECRLHGYVPERK